MMNPPSGAIEMRQDDLLNLLRERPFHPFRIHMSDGTNYDIRHPDLAIVLKRYVIIGVSSNGGRPDRVDRCSLLHVVRVEDLNGEGE
jgi:hypothetical protein